MISSNNNQSKVSQSIWQHTQQTTLAIIICEYIYIYIYIYIFINMNMFVRVRIYKKYLGKNK